MLTFHTEKLNRQQYTWIFKSILNTLDVNVDLFLKSWDIKIYPLDKTTLQFFDHVVLEDGQKINPKMPSGVTGKKEMQLWLHDDDNDWLKDTENAERIQHEVCHAVLFDKYGTASGIWSKGVHDRVDNQRIIKRLWFRKGLTFWKKIKISIINITDLL